MPLTALSLTPPGPPGTPEFAGWIDDDADYLLRHCPLERGATFYFDFTGGNDANDGVSPATPFKTLAKARTVFAAATVPTRFRFKRGEVWRDTVGLDFAAKVVTLDSYGSTGAAPRLTAFALQWTTGWTLVTGTTYKRTVASGGAVAWVAYTNDRFTFLMRAGSTTLTAGQWFWNAGTSEVYVNIGSNPNLTPLEAVQANSQHGVNLAADGSRCHDLECNGFGMDPAASNNQFYAFSSRATGSAAVAFTYCQGFFTSGHAIAQFNGGGGSGGTTLFKNCRAGGCLYTSAGCTVFNAYADNGANNAFVLDCDVAYGMLPSSEWTNGTTPTRNGLPVYGHTAGAAMGLVVVRRTYIAPNKWGAGGNAQCGNPRAVGNVNDLATYGFFVVGETLPRGDPANAIGAGNLFALGGQNAVYLDCSYDLTPAEPGGLAALGLAAPGNDVVWLGGTIRIDFVNTTAANLGIINSNVAGFLNWGPRMIGTEIRVLPKAGQTVSFDFPGSFGGGTYAQNLYLVGCLLSNEGAGTFYIGALNDGTHQVANAYWRIAPDGTYQGIGNDAQRVELSREPQYGIRRLTDPWGPLYAAGPAGLPGGLAPRTSDPNGQPLFGQRNIGPWAFVGSDAVALSTLLTRAVLGLSGPRTVTLTFHDADGDPVPLVDFTVAGQGPGRADGSGVATFGLPDGTYTVTARPTGGTIFPDMTLTVAGTTAATITGSLPATVTPSGDPATTTAFGTARDGHGAAQAGVAVDFKLTDPLAAGVGTGVWSRATFRVTSDGSGLLATPLVKGATYAARWAAATQQQFTTFTVPADAGPTWELPEIVGPL